MDTLEGLMDRFAIKEIKRNFPSFEGWTIGRAVTPAKDCRMFVVERKIRNVKTHFHVLVAFAKKIPEAAIDALEKSPALVPATETQGIKNVILIPLNANVPKVPETIKVISMKHFTFDGENLTWLKNPAMRRIRNQEIQAATS
jgi:hypothetical protein